MPMRNETALEGPGQVALRSFVEFKTWCELVLHVPENHPKFSITKVEWMPDRSWSVVRSTGMDGELQDHMIAKAIQRMVAVRSRRRDHQTGEMMPPPLQWRAMLKRHFAPMYEGAGLLEVSDGWFDLIAGMSDMVHEIEDADDRHKFADIKSKYAELRADHHSQHTQICAVVEAFEQISGHVCETCGAPGAIEGPGWLVVACAEHSRKKK